MFQHLPALVVRRLTLTDASVSPELPARLLSVCDAVLRKNAEGFEPSEHWEEWRWMLAALALEEGIPANRSDAAWMAARIQFRSCLLPGEVARSLAINPARSTGAYNEVLALAGRFTCAIKPSRLQALLREPQCLRRRVEAFLKKRPLSDEDVAGQARLLLKEQAPAISPTRIERFGRVIPADRLRTYPRALLSQVIGHFIDWDPLMEFLENPAAQPANELRYHALVRALAQSAAGREPWAATGVSADEAAQMALSEVIEALHDPWSGYVYESNFVVWLTAAMTAVLRSNRSVARRETLLNALDD